MPDYVSLRDEILHLLEPLTATARDRRAEQTADRLCGAHERLLSGELTVVVCGEFNRGKSSLLNALLERPNILPVDPYFATSVAAVIRHGAPERAEVTLRLSDGTLKQERILLDRIGDYAAEGGKHSGEAVLLDLRLDVPRLESGLVLVDTPGVGGVYHHHTAVTMGQLPSADAVLFVLSAEEPLSDSETAFLREAAHAVRAADHPDALFHVLTKSDLREDIGADLAAGRRKIAAVTGRDPEDVLIVPVSSRLKQLHLAGVAEDDPERRARLLAASGFPRLEEALWSRLAAHRARLLLGGALVEAQAAVRTLLEPLLTEESALRDGSRARLEELRAETERESERLAELSSGAAPWRERLARELATLRTETADRTRAEFERVWRRAETEHLEVRAHLTKPARLADRINADLTLARSTVGEWAARRAAALQSGLARELGVELAGGTLGELPPAPVLDLGGFGRLHRPTREVREVEPATYRTVTRQRQAKRASGPAPSGFVNKARHLYRQAQDFLAPRYESYQERVLDRPERVRYRTVEEEIPERVLGERRRELAEAVGRARRDQEPLVARAVEEAVAAFARDIAAELDSRIEREQERTADTLERLRRSAERTAAEAARRLGELEAEQRPLRELGERVVVLADAVQGLAGREAAAPDSPDSPDGPGGRA
ncbi:dynamin family protein [Kitasatospora purpeofusca]|uniref:dynamin family protein n=1 Tax=Kitasatospora purpeofusca TaxID=67352 RepID=UPI00365F895A